MPVTKNERKVKSNYEILKTYEAGVVLSGGEVKSVRANKTNLSGGHIKIYNEEAWVIGIQISPYQEKNTDAAYEPTQSRKLLLHKKEIAELIGKTKEKGLTIIPIKWYNKKRTIKLEIALVKGKKQFEKKEAIQSREVKRTIDRVFKRAHRAYI